jgi:UDP-glucose 4-epimerase
MTDAHRVAPIADVLEDAGRRADDPAHIVAACDRVRSTLGWRPHFNDLEAIVTHALARERKLARRGI